MTTKRKWIWVTRDVGTSTTSGAEDEIVIWHTKEAPIKNGSGLFAISEKGKLTDFCIMSIKDFSRIFGETPRRGSCRQAKGVIKWQQQKRKGKPTHPSKSL